MKSLTVDSKEIQQLQKQFGDSITIYPGQLVENQSDPAFYCEGYGHSYVASITDQTNGKIIMIYCDGEMRINLKQDEQGHSDTLRHNSDLFDHGFDTDKKLYQIDPDCWAMNPWFDMYLEDEWLNHVHFDVLKEGFPIAKDILLRLRGNNE